MSLAILSVADAQTAISNIINQAITAGTLSALGGKGYDIYLPNVLNKYYSPSGAFAADNLPLPAMQAVYAPFLDACAMLMNAGTVSGSNVVPTPYLRMAKSQPYDPLAINPGLGYSLTAAGLAYFTAGSF